MAMELDEVLSLSLDDYIANSKKAKSDQINGNNLCCNNESKFKAERRKHITEEEDEEEDEAIDAGNTTDSAPFGIWKGPDSNTKHLKLDYMQDEFDERYNDAMLQKPQTQHQPIQRNSRVHQQQYNSMGSKFDLREKITGNAMSTAQVPHANSQQWRLMQPNIGYLRPAGMPPLMKPEALTVTRPQWRNHNNRNRNRNNKQFGNNGNGFGNQNRRSYESGCNNGRVQRNNQQRNNQEAFNKNMIYHLSNGHINEPVCIMPARMTIEVPSNSIDITGTRNSISNGRILKQPMEIPRTAAANAVLNMHAPQRAVGNDSLKALLGVQDSVNAEMMPMLASKFLDFIQNGSQPAAVHKPIYDMKVQKEIHEMREKPLLYKCSSGEVVSSDGSGIDCQVTPRTSGVSMNYRFA